VSYSFNPPPGWPPLPPEWDPPLGWRPEPHWPPVPAGWRLWVPASRAPRCSATSAWLQRHGVAVGAALGTLVLVFVLATSVTVRRDPPAYAGVGSAVVALSLDPARAHHATITHRGSATFRVTTLAASGREIARLVDHVGAYSGTHHLNPVETPAAVRVEADGPWRMVVVSRAR
jgi:hypothetical protein